MACILVTAGPTREHLDEVRFLANGSTGRMGYALAAASLEAGHEVHLVSGPVDLEPPPGARVASVVSALEMQAAAEAVFESCDVAFAAAAVADHRPAHRAEGKPAKNVGPTTLELLPNPDIAAGLGARKGRRVVVGFALQSTEAGLEAALSRGFEKLRAKGLDLIAVNLSDALGAADSEVVVLDEEGGRQELPRQSKRRTAEQLVGRAVALWERKNGRG